MEMLCLIGVSAAFRSFIKDELFPAISQRYKTKSRKGIIGESLAGLFIIETLMLDGSMFDDYIAVDPSLWWNNQYLLKNADSFLSQLPADRQKGVWVAGSGAADISNVVKKLSEVVKVRNLPQLQWQYSDEKNEKHITIYRATKEKALFWTIEQ